MGDGCWVFLLWQASLRAERGDEGDDDVTACGFTGKDVGIGERHLTQRDEHLAIDAAIDSHFAR